MHLDGLGLPHAVLLHVDQLALVSVDAPRALALGVLGAQVGEHAHGALARVLDQCSRDDLEGLSHRPVGPLLDTLNALGQLVEAHRDGHLGSTTAGGEPGVEHDVSRNAHGVLQVSLNLVQDILGRAAEEDRASLGRLALGEEGEVLVADLLDLEQAALRTHVRLLDVLYPVDDGSAGGPRYPVVVCLADTTKSRHVRLHKIMLCKIYPRSSVT